MFYYIYIYFFFTGDYPEDFLKTVGWNVERNPGSEDLPENLVPGSDDDIDLEDDFDQLFIGSLEKEGKEEENQEEESSEEESEVEQEDEMKNIDIYLEHGVFDPRKNYGTRSRVNFVAVLDSGVKLDSIEVFIDRNNNKVFLTGEYISSLRFAKLRMGDLAFANNCQQMEACYQTFLNSKSYQQTFKMSGKIPKSIEVENSFVDPETNLPVDDPIYPIKVLPDTVDGTATEAHIVHFYALVVQKESNGNGVPNRSRRFYNTRSGQQAPGTYSFAGNHGGGVPQGYTMPSGAGWSHGSHPPAPVPMATAYGHQPQARVPAASPPTRRAAPQTQVRPPTPQRRQQEPYAPQESVPEAHPVPMAQVPEVQSARGGAQEVFDEQQPEQYSSVPEVRQAQDPFVIQAAAYRAAVARMSSPTNYNNESSGAPTTRRSRRTKVPRRSQRYILGHDVHSEVNNFDDGENSVDNEHRSLSASEEIAEILDDDPTL